MLNLPNKLNPKQKTNTRIEENEGHPSEKLAKRKGILTRLTDMLYGKGKPKK